mmetsp:Transcript_56279/g.127724  ORF Transcript_56279/g.127724 Transcript_56279/m.127724 type:complete len:478 (-) Transcript_56279:975-2408(-)
MPPLLEPPRRPAPRANAGGAGRRPPGRAPPSRHRLLQLTPILMPRRRQRVRVRVAHASAQVPVRMRDGEAEGGPPELGRDGERVLGVEHGVPPELGHDEHVARLLVALERLEALHLEPRQVVLHPVQHLLLAHEVAPGREQIPVLLAVEELVPGRVVEVHGRPAARGAKGPLHVDKRRARVFGPRRGALRGRVFRGHGKGPRGPALLALLKKGAAGLLGGRAPGLLVPNPLRGDNIREHVVHVARDWARVGVDERVSLVRHFWDWAPNKHVPGVVSALEAVFRHLINVGPQRVALAVVGAELLVVGDVRDAHFEVAVGLLERLRVVGFPPGVVRVDPAEEHRPVHHDVPLVHLLGRHERRVEHVRVAAQRVAPERRGQALLAPAARAVQFAHRVRPAQHAGRLLLPPELGFQVGRGDGGPGAHGHLPKRVPVRVPQVRVGALAQQQLGDIGVAVRPRAVEGRHPVHVFRDVRVRPVL